MKEMFLEIGKHKVLLLHKKYFQDFYYIGKKAVSYWNELP